METTGYRLSMTSRAYDVDQAKTDPEAMSYRLARADRADLPPHDPIPLFLSDPEGEPDPREFSPRGVRSRAGFATQIVASVLAAAAVAVLVVLFHSDVSRLFAMNAGAWMGSVMANQAATPPAKLAVVRPAPSKDPARVAAPIQLASAEASNIAVSPSREAIAAAYQTAVQAQSSTPSSGPSSAAITAVVAAPPVPPAPVKTLDPDALAGLMTRANGLIAIGDIAAARLLLERAAHAQDATAAFLLAQTYDPAVLGTRDTRSITADPALARDWYQKAAQLGSGEARQRLAQLQN